MSKNNALSQFEQIVAIFIRHGVEFLVIGGQAEVLMGSPRATYDTDFAYRRTPENLTRLVAALKEIRVWLRGAPEGLPFILDERTLASGSNFTFDSPYGALDLLGYVEPLGDFESVVVNAEVVEHGDFRVRMIGLEDLIRVKRHIRRKKDEDSLVQLLAIREYRAKTKPQAE